MNIFCDTCGTRDELPHTGREASRLTDVDRETMDARLCEMLAGWAQSMPTRQYSPTAGDVVAMTRAMVHAIGCTVADLRVCELEEIHARACAVVGATYDHAGRLDIWERRRADAAAVIAQRPGGLSRPVPRTFRASHGEVTS